jgi:hypothetical protein
MKSLGTIKVGDATFTLAQNMKTGAMKWYSGSFQVPTTPAFKTVDKALVYAARFHWITDGSEFNERRTPSTY